MAKSVDNLPVVPCYAQFLPGGRCVALLHTMADGLSSHFDWLCESTSITAGGVGGAGGAGGDDDRSLIAFRAARSPADLQSGESMPLERLADHRRLYLEYEGPIAGDRGTVRRVATGIMREIASAGSALKLHVRWQVRNAEVGAKGAAAIAQTMLIEQQSDSNWLVRCETCEKAAE